MIRTRKTRERVIINSPRVNVTIWNHWRWWHVEHEHTCTTWYIGPFVALFEPGYPRHVFSPLFWVAVVMGATSLGSAYLTFTDSSHCLLWPLVLVASSALSGLATLLETTR